MRRLSFMLLLGLLLSLGAADFCSAQWQPISAEGRRWEIDVGSDQFWPVYRDRGFPHDRFERTKDHRRPISLPEGRVLKPEQVSLITGIIKDDFLVNDDTTSGCWQESPAVALDTSGNFLLCWGDARNGFWDIYAQRYNSLGDKVGTNFRVNDDVGISRQSWPSIAMDANGNFVICWEDERHDWSFPDVYAQRYNNLGDALGANFRVSDDVGISRQSWPSIAMDANGDFVICWEDERNGWFYPDIYAQRYSSSGGTLGANFRVNDDAGSSSQRYPSIAMDGDGDFVICWVDDRNGDSDIYVQRYSSSGDTLGANFRVNNDIVERGQSFPSISMAEHGDFVICWQDGQNGDADIYAQRYSSLGDTLGANFKVNEDAGTSFQGYPSIAMDGDGCFVICWEDYRSGDGDIYAQRFSSSGDILGVNFRVNDDAGTVEEWSYPSIAVDADGGFVTCWEDERNGVWHNSDIYAQRYNSSGDTLGANFSVNDDVGSSFQYDPLISTNAGGHFVICWEDYRNGESDIYAQRNNNLGDTLGANFRVNDDTNTSQQWFSSISMDTAGGFAICWQDERNSNYDIYAQRYSSSGDTLGANFRVNDNASTSEQWYPSISMDANGDFIICWYDYRNGGWNPDIYAQRYDNSGDTLGINFRVNDDIGTNVQYDPSVAMDANGAFVICWNDYRDGEWNPDIYAQRYNGSGDTLGTNFKVSDHGAPSSQYSPSVARDASGNFVICWYDDRSGDYDIYAQRYRSDGTAWGTNYLVNQEPGAINPNQFSSSVTVCNDRMAFAWMDARRSKGWDIYAKVVTWDWEKVDEPGDNAVGVPKDFVLLQNYPNPFNSTTAISYRLSAVSSQLKDLRRFRAEGENAFG